MSKILIVKNVTREGPGLFEEVLIRERMHLTIIHLDDGDAWPPLNHYSGMIIFGGPDSANDKTQKIQKELTQIQAWLESGRPYLGICLGLQLVVKAAGGRVIQSPVKEIGFQTEEGVPYEVRLTSEAYEDALMQGLPSFFRVFHLHGETVELAPGMKVLGEGNFCRHQIVRVREGVYGIQGHVEIDRSLLEEWLREDPDLRREDPNIILEQYAQIQNELLRIVTQLGKNFAMIVRGYKERTLAHL